MERKMGHAWQVMGEFFESLFALWSIGGTNNGWIGGEKAERGRKMEGRRKQEEGDT